MYCIHKYWFYNQKNFIVSYLISTIIGECLNYIELLKYQDNKVYEKLVILTLKKIDMLTEIHVLEKNLGSIRYLHQNDLKILYGQYIKISR